MPLARCGSPGAAYPTAGGGRSPPLARLGPPAAENASQVSRLLQDFHPKLKLRVERLNDIVVHMEPAPRKLAANLWVIDRPFKLPIVRAEIGTRMTCIGLADGCLLLHSPVKLDTTLRRWLNALGEIRAIVAPNKLHHLYLAEYITSYPSARIYAAPGLSQKRPEIRFDGELSDEPRNEWRGQLKQHLFRGAPPTERGCLFPSRHSNIGFD